jgi:hypothetical protein
VPVMFRLVLKKINFINVCYLLFDYFRSFLLNADVLGDWIWIKLGTRIETVSC